MVAGNSRGLGMSYLLAKTLLGGGPSDERMAPCGIHRSSTVVSDTDMHKIIIFTVCRDNRMQVTTGGSLLTLFQRRKVLQRRDRMNIDTRRSQPKSDDINRQHVRIPYIEETVHGSACSRGQGHGTGLSLSLYQAYTDQHILFTRLRPLPVPVEVQPNLNTVEANLLPSATMSTQDPLMLRQIFHPIPSLEHVPQPANREQRLELIIAYLDKQSNAVRYAYGFVHGSTYATISQSLHYMKPPRPRSSQGGPRRPALRGTAGISDNNVSPIS